MNAVRVGGSPPIKGTLAVGSPGHGIENEDMIIVMKRMAKMMVVVSQSPGMRLGGQDQASHATGSQSGCFFLQIKVFKFFRGVFTSQFSNAFESSWHCLSSSPACSSSNLLGNHRLHSHTSYLSFFLHRQNFWGVKFTLKTPIFRVKSVKKRHFFA